MTIIWIGRDSGGASTQAGRDAILMDTKLDEGQPTYNYGAITSAHLEGPFTPTGTYDRERYICEIQRHDAPHDNAVLIDCGFIARLDKPIGENNERVFLRALESKFVEGTKLGAVPQVGATWLEAAVNVDWDDGAPIDTTSDFGWPDGLIDSDYVVQDTDYLHYFSCFEFIKTKGVEPGGKFNLCVHTDYDHVGSGFDIETSNHGTSTDNPFWWEKWEIPEPDPINDMTIGADPDIAPPTGDTGADVYGAVVKLDWPSTHTFETTISKIKFRKHTTSSIDEPTDGSPVYFNVGGLLAQTNLTDLGIKSISEAKVTTGVPLANAQATTYYYRAFIYDEYDDWSACNLMSMSRPQVTSAVLEKWNGSAFVDAGTNVDAYTLIRSKATVPTNEEIVSIKHEVEADVHTPYLTDDDEDIAAGVQYKEYAYTTSGAKTLKVWSKNAYGFVSDPATDSVTVDKTDPVIRMAIGTDKPIRRRPVHISLSASRTTVADEEITNYHVKITGTGKATINGASIDNSPIPLGGIAGFKIVPSGAPGGTYYLYVVGRDLNGLRQTAKETILDASTVTNTDDWSRIDYFVFSDVIAGFSLQITDLDDVEMIVLYPQKDVYVEVDEFSSVVFAEADTDAVIYGKVTDGGGNDEESVTVNITAASWLDFDNDFDANTVIVPHEIPWNMIRDEIRPGNDLHPRPRYKNYGGETVILKVDTEDTTDRDALINLGRGGYYGCKIALFGSDYILSLKPSPSIQTVVGHPNHLIWVGEFDIAPADSNSYIDA